MRRVRLWKWAIPVLVFFLFASMGGGFAAAQRDDEAVDRKVHGFLLQQASERPTARVEVIVQMEKGREMPALDPGWEAKTKADLKLINGKVLELPLRAVRQMAQNANIRYISPNAEMAPSSLYTPVGAHLQTLQLTSSFWGSDVEGGGIGVAVLDSGISDHVDLKPTKIDVVIQGIALGSQDNYGHGTHVAGIIAGKSADGRFLGVAPKAKLYNIKIGDNQGMAREGDLIKGLEWVNDHAGTHNIRVVNISSQSQIAQSYHTAPLSAAVEQLWFKGIVVVVSAGNRGSVSDAMYYPPSNDPFVISVGALSDNDTADRADDWVPAWSSRGFTQDGFPKPDVLTPGHRVLAPLAAGSYLGQQMPDRIVNSIYIRMSGTSMAAPVISGLAANLLAKAPTLTPDQIKWLVVNHTYGAGRPGTQFSDPTLGVHTAGMAAPELIWARIGGGDLSTVGSANSGLTPNQYLLDSSGGVSSSNVFWENVYWENVYWENVYWENIYWE